MVVAYRNLAASLLLLTLIIAGCSTERNTLLSRSYHGVTARYNGHFNATELIRMSLQTYRSSLQENYYEILPIEPLPTKDQVIGMYSSIDTAIAKCTKVIQRHSMPSNDKPALKKAEFNNWIDENWTTIGVAFYYRRDYDAALKNFSFIRKFFSNDPSIYVADLWMAKTNIQLGNYTEAGFNLSKIDEALERENAESENEKNTKSNSKKSKSKKKSSSSSSKKKEKKEAKVPKSILFDFKKTKADLELKRKNPQEAIKFLEESLKYAKKKTDKSRVHFILGQLNELVGNRETAKEEYGKTLKYTAPYEMHFNARLKRAFMGGDEKIKRELLKMLRDAKNAQYKDQIYYALADIELQNGNEPLAVEYLTQSAFYSTTNKRQKGMAYEKLGNLAFAKKSYINAQKYYDSCARIIDDAYPNAIGVKNKATKLSDLVKAVEIAEYEDSVQRIAKLSEDDREKFLKKVIKQQKEEAEQKKKKEAEKLRELQQNQNNFAQNSGNGSKWYFNNPKTRTEGYDEFRKMWGTRENTDDWRRSERLPTISTTTAIKDTSKTSAPTSAVDSTSNVMDEFMAKIPLTDTAFSASMDRLLNALYNAGIIYKEQLNEKQLAEKQFQHILDKQTENPIDLSAAYQLFKLNDSINTQKASQYKSYILTNYPNSDYANFMRDPDFFLKRKEQEKLAEQEYVVVLERYNRGLYYPVIARADLVIENEKENKFRAKYMLLKALSIGQTTSDKQQLVPVLNQVIAEYPKTDEQKKAQELLDIIKNGVSKNDPVDFTRKSPFEFKEDAEQWIIVFLDKEDNSNTEKIKVAEFNREFFSRDKLRVSSKIYGDDQSIILVQAFPDDLKAIEYIRVFKATRKHLMDLQKAKIVIITQENMKILFEKRNLPEYELFYDEFY